MMTKIFLLISYYHKGINIFFILKFKINEQVQGVTKFKTITLK